MNELLLRHGCCTVFSLPPGLKELMSDISREVLREQPVEIYEFITNYLSALLITREHGVLAVKILDDLCDCKPTLVEHLQEIGFKFKKSTRVAEVIQTEIEDFEPTIGNERFVEAFILKKVLEQFRNVPEDEKIAKLLQVIRNAYKDYWFRKNLMAQHVLNKPPLETWEQAVENTLNIYKKTKPSLAELHRASLKIQTAYRGYYIRRQMKKAPTFEIPSKVDTRPLDIADSREIDLGPFLKMNPKDDASRAMLEAHRQNLKYDPLHAIDFRPDRPDPGLTLLGSEDASMSQHSWESEAAVEKLRDDMEREKESEHATEKKISFAGVTLRNIEEDTQSAAYTVETPLEEIPIDIATGVVDDIIKAIPTGSLDQIPVTDREPVDRDQSTKAEGQENIPEQITENVPTQETDNVQEEIPETLPEKITENAQEEIPETLPEKITENAQEVPEQIAETVTDQIEADTNQGTEDIPEQIAGDQVPESAPEQGSAAIPEQNNEAAQENGAVTENIQGQTANEEAYNDPTVDVQAMKKAQGQGAALDHQDPTVDYADHKPMQIHDLAPDMVEQQQEPRV